MSTPVLNPPSNRFPFDLTGVHPEVARAIRWAFNGLTNHEQAFAALQAKTATATTENVTENITGSSETIVESGSPIGNVNNQAGVTSYATQQSDYGAFILLNDASAIAISLTVAPVITLPWFAVFINSGTGTATLTPAAGTINGNANFALLGGQVVTVIFDGTNFEIAPLLALPVNTPGVSHQWIASYDAVTGVFTLSQPAIADVSGLVAALALLAPIASPTFTGVVTEPAPPVLTAATTATSATAGAGSALPANPAGYLEVSINGTTFKIPYYPV